VGTERSGDRAEWMRIEKCIGLPQSAFESQSALLEIARLPLLFFLRERACVEIPQPRRQPRWRRTDHFHIDTAEPRRDRSLCETWIRKVRENPQITHRWLPYVVQFSPGFTERPHFDIERPRAALLMGHVPDFFGDCGGLDEIFVRSFGTHLPCPLEVNHCVD